MMQPIKKLSLIKRWCITYLYYRAVLNQVAGKEKKRTKKRKSRGTETPAQDELRDEERDRKRERKHKKHDKVGWLVG